MPLYTNRRLLTLQNPAQIFSPLWLPACLMQLFALFIFGLPRNMQDILSKLNFK